MSDILIGSASPRRPRVRRTPPVSTMPATWNRRPPRRHSGPQSHSDATISTRGRLSSRNDAQQSRDEGSGIGVPIPSEETHPNGRVHDPNGRVQDRLRQAHWLLRPLDPDGVASPLTAPDPRRPVSFIQGPPNRDRHEGSTARRRNHLHAALPWALAASMAGASERSKAIACSASPPGTSTITSSAGTTSAPRRRCKPGSRNGQPPAGLFHPRHGVEITDKLFDVTRNGVPGIHSRVWHARS